MLPCDKKGGDAKFQPSFKYLQENAPDCHKGHVKLQWFWFRMKICENLGLIENLCLSETSSQTRKMRYPAVKLTDCGKTCTLTKLQTAEPEKIEVKFV